MMLKGCKVYADATAIYRNGQVDAREQRAREELADAEAGRPTRKRPRLPDRQDALLQALELHTWAAADASCKLMRLQLQPYNLPFPAAYHSGDDAYAVASWVTNRIPGSNAQCRACNDKNLSRYHIAARCTESSRLLRPIIDWRIRALHLNRADTGVAIDYVAIQLNDYARLTAPPAREDGRLRPRRMPDPRDPTFRVSDRQRRWLAVLGMFIRAVAARCIRGESFAISAQGVAALAGLDATLWNEISDDEDNENARVAVEVAEHVLDDPALVGFLGGADAGPPGRPRDDPVPADREHDVADPAGGSIANDDHEEAAIMPEDDTADPGRDAAARHRRRVQHHTPTMMMTAIVLRCIANAVGRSTEVNAGPEHEACMSPSDDAPSPASPPGRVPSPLDGHSAAVLERRAQSWRPP
ncbi:Reverse transcriptase domain-containing protein [Plasmodiophora brassicae]